MRKFDQPFDSYELTVDRPMIVELSPQRGFYNYLINNPLYYYHAFQYTHGEFYRAVFGYEEMWDQSVEKDLMMALDFMLCFWAKKRNYYIEEIVIDRRAKFEAVRWKRGIKPRRLNFNERHCFRPGHKRAVARINALDSPFHVDVELYSGDIFSIPYPTYMRLKNRRLIRSLDHASPPRKNESHAKNDGTSAVERLEGLGRKVAFKALYDQLPPLRQRVRRKGAL